MGEVRQAHCSVRAPAGNFPPAPKPHQALRTGNSAIQPVRTAESAAEARRCGVMAGARPGGRRQPPTWLAENRMRRLTG